MLITGVEQWGWITHPRIARRMAEEYGFGVDVYNQLVHESRRAKKLPPLLPEPDARSWAGFKPWAKDHKLDMDDDLYIW